MHVLQEIECWEHLYAELADCYLTKKSSGSGPSRRARDGRTLEAYQGEARAMPATLAGVEQSVPTSFDLLTVLPTLPTHMSTALRIWLEFAACVVLIGVAAPFARHAARRGAKGAASPVPAWFGLAAVAVVNRAATNDDVMPGGRHARAASADAERQQQRG